MSDMHVQTVTPFFNLSLSVLVDPPYGAEPGDSCPHGEPDTEPCELAILSVDGPDRVGLVSRLCHWLEKNTVTIESGQAGLLSSLRETPRAAFVGQYMLSAEPERMERLRQTLRPGNRLSDPFEDDPGEADIEPDSTPPLHYQITVYADDQRGILARVADLMAKNGFNITAQLCQTLFGPGSSRRSRPGSAILQIRAQTGDRQEKVSAQSGGRRSLTERQAISLLEAIPAETLQGIRDLALMSVFFLLITDFGEPCDNPRVRPRSSSSGATRGDTASH
jgi:glycine cleavage system regulatory protein